MSLTAYQTALNESNFILIADAPVTYACLNNSSCKVYVHANRKWAMGDEQWTVDSGCTGRPTMIQWTINVNTAGRQTDAEDTFLF
ncbi:hypothetical protein H4I95_03936 [Botrytis cinerea]